MMENEDSFKIVDIRDIFIATDTCYKLLLEDDIHITKICPNLIFTGILDDNGYDIQFGKVKWKLVKSFPIIYKGMKKYILYYLHDNLSKEEVNVVEKDYDIEF